MAIQENYFNPGQLLRPAQPSAFEKLSPWKMGPSLTIKSGQAMARKSADGKAYPLNVAATDGTQIFGGFSEAPFTTDSLGNVNFTFTAGTPTGWLNPPSNYAAVWTGGIFNPFDLLTAGTGSPAAEVDTVTIGGTIAVGDTFAVNSSAAGDAAVFTATATTTTNVVAGLTSAWNANPALASVGTAVATSATVMTVTGVKSGAPLGITVGKTSTSGTIVDAITTSASAGSAVEIDTFTFGTAVPSIGDTFTLTATFPNLSTQAVSFTATAASYANVASGLAAAWNTASGTYPWTTSKVALATPTSTTTVLTGTYFGQPLNVVATTTSTSTVVTKTVTTPASGCNLSDILPGNPGAHILQPNGFWEIP